MQVPLDGFPRMMAAKAGATAENSGALACEPGPVLTLPAPAREYDEDRTEALWLIRSLTTGQPVTGGASGWVPPEVRTLRTRLLDCEEGRADASTILTEMRAKGIFWAEIALLKAGAVREDPWPQAGYEMYRFTPTENPAPSTIR
jgi:hypothetical protein